MDLCSCEIKSMQLKIWFCVNRLFSSKCSAN